jgi:SAM-dependent methyltransferase
VPCLLLFDLGKIAALNRFAGEIDVSRELSLAEIFQLGYYWETKILLTAVKLDVFSAIDEKPKTTQDVASRLQADGPTLQYVLNALVAMKLLRKDGEMYGNSSIARKYLVRHSPEYVGHLLLLHDAEWNNWGKLEEIIRTGRRAVDRHIFETDPELGGNVLTVLNRIGRQSGPDFAKGLHLKGQERILDLGGGVGTNAIAFCQAYPELDATVLDLPATLKLTEKTIKEAGFESRIRLLPGDFNRDPLGGPYDVVLMSDILHYQTFQMNQDLVRKVFASLVPGGRLVIKDRFLDEAGTGPAWTTAFAVHILVNTQQGSCYKTSDAIQWLCAAGFVSVVELRKTAVVQGLKSD